MKEFVIDFSYQGVRYTALVIPKTGSDQDGYTVKLQRENQEFELDIFAIPCGNDKMEWCFRDAGDLAPYDKDLLVEIGEAIERHQTQTTE
jgi:hypothetical protein